MCDQADCRGKSLATTSSRAVALGLVAMGTLLLPTIALGAERECGIEQARRIATPEKLRWVRYDTDTYLRQRRLNIVINGLPAVEAGHTYVPGATGSLVRKPLYVCRVKYGKYVRVGKLVGGSCSISVNLVRKVMHRYEVLTGHVPPEQWADHGDRSNLSHPFAVTFHWVNDDPLKVKVHYLCRAPYNTRELHPGVQIGDKCYFAYGGKIRITTNFQVMYLAAPLCPY